MSFDEKSDGDLHGECAAEIHRLERELTALRQPPADVPPRAWLIASKNGLVIRRTLLSEPTQEQRDCAAFDGDTITPLYDHPPAKSPADVAALVERLRYIGDTDDAKYPGIRVTMYEAAYAIASLSARCAELETRSATEEYSAMITRADLAETELAQAQEDAERLRKLIPGCDCANPSQCWEPCGTLGHSEQHARVVSTTMSVEEFNERKAAIDTARAREGE